MFLIKFFLFLLIPFFIGSETFAEVSELKINSLDNNYLDSKDALNDYILDTGDYLEITFINVPELSKVYKIDSEGEIFFNRTKETYVRGLTISELEVLLKKRFSEFFINPEIYIRINKFKPIRAKISGEVRNPGFIIFDPNENLNQEVIEEEEEIKKSKVEDQNFTSLNSLLNSGNKNSENFYLKTKNSKLTLSNAIKMVGGLTAFSDITNIEIVRDNPLSKGGGKKRTSVNLSDFLNGRFSSNQDIRIFNGDYINIPRLTRPNDLIVYKSIVNGLSPKFIEVYVFGRVENPGTYLIPIEGTLSDALMISGPRRILSGKIFLTRYNRDGSLLRSNIKFSSSAKPGSKRNPFLQKGDYIAIQNSRYGKLTEQIKVLTDPILNIYTLKNIYDDFAGND